MIVVKRALVSCYDKSRLERFAKTLTEVGIELVASGGTAQYLRQHGLPVVSVEQFAGIAEQLDGRVKTLNPKIHRGILARRDEPTHVAAAGESLIDLVVVNLYPFEQTVQQATVSLAEAVEQIDIGGVALLRAAAKNFAGVGAVSEPQQYELVADALRQHHGHLPEALARQLAVAAFELTSRYDQRIAEYLRMGLESHAADQRPQTVTLALHQRQVLRYGENPHQRGGWYLDEQESAWALGQLTQHQGKELSANNLLDMDGALRCLLDLDAPACAIIKHHSPCGLATASDIAQAFESAYACDPESAFGGIIGCNRPVTAALAERITGEFFEGVLAPAFEPGAESILKKKTALRVVTIPWPVKPPQRVEWRQLLGGWLLQDMDLDTSPGSWRVVTKRAATLQEQHDLAFAWLAAKHAKSNGIVLARHGATVGIGQGQPSRVGAVRLAVQRAGARCQDSVAASDGFFPFPDGVEELAAAGVRAVIQPGGSIRDQAVIAAADATNMAMVFTGRRHFRH